jgi:hypothetical protein
MLLAGSVGRLYRRLELVAEYHKEALLAKEALHSNRPEPLTPPIF